MLLYSFVFFTLARWAFGQEEEGNETTGSDTAVVTMKICELVSCPVEVQGVHDTSNPPKKKSFSITPDLKLDITFKANFFSCKITGMKVTGTMKSSHCDQWWDTEINNEIKLGEMANGIGEKDSKWTVAYVDWYEYLCANADIYVALTRNQENSCSRFKASLSIYGKSDESEGLHVYEYDIDEKIFEFTFAPWFGETFPQISSAYDEHGERRNRSLFESDYVNKYTVAAGGAVVSFVAVAFLMKYFQQKSEYAMIEEPLTV